MHYHWGAHGFLHSRAKDSGKKNKTVVEMARGMLHKKSCVLVKPATMQLLTKHHMRCGVLNNMNKCPSCPF
ncbi:hypothetical protein Hanom_Chr11g01011601 [Helianthus anomalus]